MKMNERFSRLGSPLRASCPRRPPLDNLLARGARARSFEFEIIIDHSRPAAAANRLGSAAPSR